MAATCETCLCWRALTVQDGSRRNYITDSHLGNLGDCKANPPSQRDDGEQEPATAEWPTTYHSDWCWTHPDFGEP